MIEVSFGGKEIGFTVFAKPYPKDQWPAVARRNGYNRQLLAKQVGVSGRTLDRYFQKHLSISARQWLDELQLADAYQQVLSGKPIKTIAYDVGFKQPSHFTKRFKARFGVPPSLLAPTNQDMLPMSLGPLRPKPITFPMEQIWSTKDTL